tara:strand:+ start:2565 stop:2870 length:306 start_codon:yes stop_codon:yes gene_type:complete
MAKKSSIEKNNRRILLASKFKSKRQELRNLIQDKNTSQEDRFKAVIKLAAMPRNGSKTRIRNRCEISGRPRGYYRRVAMSRIALRTLASKGQVPGMTKASW